MYKPRYVTRTIKTKKVVVLCLDLDTKETHTDVVFIPGHLSSEDNILEYIKSTYDTIVCKPVHIVSVTEKEALYKMTEEDFVKYAEIMVEHVVEEEKE